MGVHIGDQVFMSKSRSLTYKTLREYLALIFSVKKGVLLMSAMDY